MKPAIARVFSGASYGLLQFVLLFVQNVLIVPVLISHWGNDKFGLWITCYAFIVLMRTLDIGHQNFVGNEFTKYLNLDLSIARDILGSGVRIALFTGGIEVLVFLVLVWFGLEDQIIGTEIDDGIRLGILTLMIVWWLVGGVGGILARVLPAIGQFDRSIIWAIANRIIEIALLLVVAFNDFKLSQLLFLMSIFTFVFSILLLFDIKKIASNLYPWWTYGSWKMGFKNLAVSTSLTVNNFIEQFNSNGLIILISNLLSPSHVPVFTTIRTASNMLTQVNQIIISPILPDVIKYHSIGEKGKVMQFLEINCYITSILIIIPLFVISPFLAKLYEIWLVGKIEYDFLLGSTMFSGVLFILFGKGFILYLAGINHVKALLYVNLVRIATLFPSAYIGLSHEISYLGISICFSELFASIIVPAFFVKSELGVFFKNKSMFLGLIAVFIYNIYSLRYGLCEKFELWWFLITFGACIFFIYLQGLFLGQFNKRIIQNALTYGFKK